MRGNPDEQLDSFEDNLKSSLSVFLHIYIYIYTYIYNDGFASSSIALVARVFNVFCYRLFVLI